MSPSCLLFITVSHAPFHSSNTVFHLSTASMKMPATSPPCHLLLISSPLFQSLHFPCISNRMDGVKLPPTVHSCSMYGMSYGFPSTLHCGGRKCEKTANNMPKSGIRFPSASSSFAKEPVLASRTMWKVELKSDDFVNTTKINIKVFVFFWEMKRLHLLNWNIL